MGCGDSAASERRKGVVNVGGGTGWCFETLF